MAEFDMKMDLSEISLDDIAEWPLIVRIVMVIVTCLFIVALAFMIDSKRQLKQLDLLQKSEVTLKASFEEKQTRAASLDLYREQLANITRTLGTLLDQLPNRTEVPGLLEDISALGHANGLKFSLFKPLPEVQHDFYAELPIQISLLGSYHQVARFFSDVSALDRIVTFDDFSIKAIDQNKNDNDKQNGAPKSEMLMVDLTAHTYRYVEKGAK